MQWRTRVRRPGRRSSARVTSPSRYGPVAQAFHWVTAVLVVIAFIYGPGGSEERVYSAGIDFDRQLHETLGSCVFVLAAMRLLWRVFDTHPDPPKVSRWMGIVSKAVQWAIYVLLFAVPTTAIAGAWLGGPSRDTARGRENRAVARPFTRCGRKDSHPSQVAWRYRPVARGNSRARRALPSLRAERWLARLHAAGMAGHEAGLNFPRAPSDTPPPAARRAPRSGRLRRGARHGCRPLRRARHQAPRCGRPCARWRSGARSRPRSCRRRAP